MLTGKQGPDPVSQEKINFCYERKSKEDNQEKKLNKFRTVTQEHTIHKLLCGVTEIA